MKSLAVASLALALSGASVLAADLGRPVYKAPAVAPVAVYDWSGFYIGVHGGWGRADFDHSFNIAGHYNLAPGDVFGYGDSGGMLGGHIGWNWQAGAWVFGLEGSLTKTWIDSGSRISPFFPATDVWRSELDYLGTVTGRVGYAWNAVLGYVKGGWAYARFNDHVNDTFDFVDVNSSKSGWTLGAGIEWAFAPNWILGVEYNFYDFGSVNIREASVPLAGGAAFFPGTDHDLDVTVHSVLARLSYKFGGYGKGPVVARY